MNDKPEAQVTEKTLLIIDDDAPYRQRLAQALEKRGFAVTQAESVEAGIAAARAHIGWAHAPFEIPDDVYAAWNGKPRGAIFQENWDKRFAAYAAEFPDLATEFTRRMAGDLPADWAAHVDAVLAQVTAKGETIATRKASQNSIEAYAPKLPELLLEDALYARNVAPPWVYVMHPREDLASPERPF